MTPTNSDETSTVTSQSSSATPPKEVRPPRKPFLFIGLGLLVVIIAGIVTLLLTVWSKPSVEDFKQTQTDVNGLQASYEAISSTSTAYLAKLKAASGATEASKKYDTAIASHAEKMKTISEQKSLKDEEVKAAYEAFAGKNQLFVEYSEGYTTLQKALAVCIPVFQVTKMSDANAATITQEHKKRAAKCTPVLDELEKSKVGALSDYAKKFNTVMDERQKTFDAVATSTLSEADGSKKISEIGTAFNKETNELPAKLQKARGSASVTTELKSLKDLLGKKVAQ
jgi:hypothetical protein